MEYKYLSTLNCFEVLKERCTKEHLDELEAEMRWYEEEAIDEDIGECGENLSSFLCYVYGGYDVWLEDLLEGC
jgi:hypothetical protein